MGFFDNLPMHQRNGGQVRGGGGIKGKRLHGNVDNSWLIAHMLSLCNCLRELTKYCCQPTANRSNGYETIVKACIAIAHKTLKHSRNYTSLTQQANYAADWLSHSGVQVWGIPKMSLRSCEESKLPIEIQSILTNLVGRGGIGSSRSDHQVVTRRMPYAPCPKPRKPPDLPVEWPGRGWWGMLNWTRYKGISYISIENRELLYVMGYL